jgi:hypothetical protein
MRDELGCGPSRTSADDGELFLIGFPFTVTTANKIEVISPQPRKVARSFSQVHYQSIDFIAERTENLDMHAARVAVEDRSDGEDFTRLHCADHSAPARVRLLLTGSCGYRLNRSRYSRNHFHVLASAYLSAWTHWLQRMMIGSRPSDSRSSFSWRGSPASPSRSQRTLVLGIKGSQNGFGYQGRPWQS